MDNSLKTSQDDRRIQRTQKALRDALIALALERGYEAVTIRDIADRADIAYSTFFRHYPDKEALLRDMAQESIGTLNEMTQVISHNKPIEVGRLIFTHIAEHEPMYRIILSSQEQNPVLRSVYDSIITMIVRNYQSRGVS